MQQHQYIDILQRAMVPSAETLHGNNPYIFQQDNALCHTAETVKAFYRDQGIEVMKWHLIMCLKMHGIQLTRLCCITSRKCLVVAVSRRHVNGNFAYINFYIGPPSIRPPTMGTSCPIIKMRLSVLIGLTATVSLRWHVLLLMAAFRRIFFCSSYHALTDNWQGNLFPFRLVFCLSLKMTLSSSCKNTTKQINFILSMYGVT